MGDLKNLLICGSLPNFAFVSEAREAEFPVFSNEMIIPGGGVEADDLPPLITDWPDAGEVEEKDVTEEAGDEGEEIEVECVEDIEEMPDEVTAFSVMEISAAASTDFTYQIYPDNTISITGYQGGDYFVTIPDIIDGYAVTVINENAFIDNEMLIEVIVSEGVTSINENAFAGCVDLESIVIPGTVDYIADNAFEGCEKLVNEPKKCQKILPSLCGSFTAAPCSHLAVSPRITGWCLMRPIMINRR